MVKHVVPDRCCGLIVDVQKYFLSQIDRRLRAKIVANTKNLVRLLDLYRVPIVVTLERPIARKGALPAEIDKLLGERAAIFEKDYFDLSKDKEIKRHLARLKRRQAIVAGCETDVCVLQSCLGLLDLGYEVYVVEDLLFSSSRDVASALTRMQAAGATLLTYKTLYYELIERVGGRDGSNIPDDLPDAAV